MKPDANHRDASYLGSDQLAQGCEFTITGGDGINRTLLQTNGTFNGKNVVFEYIIAPKTENITHQTFIENGTINGIPNTWFNRR